MLHRKASQFRELLRDPTDSSSYELAYFSTKHVKVERSWWLKETRHVGKHFVSLIEF